MTEDLDQDEVIKTVSRERDELLDDLTEIVAAIGIGNEPTWRLVAEIDRLRLDDMEGDIDKEWWIDLGPEVRVWLRDNVLTWDPATMLAADVKGHLSRIEWSLKYRLRHVHECLRLLALRSSRS